MADNIYTIEESHRNQNCIYWIDNRHYEYVTDPNGEILNLARLTAYAEYCKAIHDAEVHHEIPKFKIGAPAFLDPIPKSEHLQFHGQDPEPIEVDGFPLLRLDR